MPVVAMTREMGSGGREVAHGVAERLGLKVILHELVEHDLANQLHVQDSAVHHLFEGGATLRERLQVSRKRLAHYATEEVIELAAQGNVLIRGWGACVILRDVSHVARIRVCAPMEARVRQLMQRPGVNDAAAARREIERNDDTHRRTLKSAHGVERENSLLYDLVLNTERNSIETCVNLVCALVQAPEHQETDASRTILHDKALEAHVRVKLRERFTVGMGVTDIDVRADKGTIVVTGKAIHSALVDDASKIAAEIDGVKGVVNRMVVVHGPRAFR
jgi:cytidylate kinase